MVAVLEKIELGPLVYIMNKNTYIKATPTQPSSELDGTAGPQFKLLDQGPNYNVTPTLKIVETKKEYCT
jgi:hypothetical protein